MNGQLKKGAVLSYINIAISIVCGFIIAPILVKSLGKSEYGAYQMTAALIGYMSILDFGLHNSVTRYVAKYQAQKDKKGEENFLAVSLVIFSALALVVIICGSVLYFCADSIYKNSATTQEIEIVKKLLVVLTINLAISMPGAVFESVVIAYEKFVFTKLVTTAKLILRFSVIMLLCYCGRSIESFVFSAFALVLVDLTLNTSVIISQFLFCKFKLKTTIKIHDFSFKYVSEIFSFSLFIFIASITDQINWKADTTILGILLGTTAVTYYSVAGNLVSYYRSFTGAISGIFLPKATKMVAVGKNNSELTDLMIKVGRIQLMIVSLILVGFIAVGQEFIVLWMGPEFKEAYVWFLCMAIPLVIPMTQSIGINILEAKKMHQFRALVYFGIALANIILTVVTVKLIGTLGAPIATGVAILIGNTFIINWYYSKKVGLEIGRFFKEVYGKLSIVIVLTAIISLFLNSFLPTSANWFVFLIKAAFIGLMYLVFLFCIGLNKTEKTEVSSMFGRKRKNDSHS